MKSIKLFTILSTIFATSAFAGDGNLRPIPQEKIEYGCGCSYHLNETSPFQIIFQAETNFELPRVFIDGVLVQLEPIKVEVIPRNPKVGDTFMQRYRYKDIYFSFFNTITFVCPNGSEGCEVTKFKTRLETNQAGKVDSIQLIGDCGC